MKHNDIINGLILSIGRSEYSFSELEYLCRPFEISGNSIRTFLSRSVKKGYFVVRKEGRTAFYRPGKKMNIITTEVANSFVIPDWSNWRNDWWGVTFSVPEADKPKRHSIRKTLKLYRFAPLTPGFWIRPRHEHDGLESKLQEIRSDTDCRMLHFKYSDPFSGMDAAKIWDLERINICFSEGINLLNKSEDTEKLSPSEALRMRILLGNRIIPMLAEDPLLPGILLPEGWLGSELRSLYFEFDRRLKKQAKPYWDSLHL